MTPGPDPARLPSPTRLEKRTFGVLLTLGAFGFLWTISPIWVPVFLGVMLAVVASPLQRKVERRFGGHPRLLAAAISFVTVALSIGIVAFLGYFVVRELLHYLTRPRPSTRRCSSTGSTARASPACWTASGSRRRA